MRVFVVFAYVLLAAYCVGAAQADCGPRPVSAPMTFELVETGDDQGLWVAAHGRITDATATELTAFLADLGARPRGIILHSAGGRLSGGLDLGHAIRAAGLATRIGVVTACGTPAMARGLCASSCAYAFLGGVDRGLGRGQIGFHRIYPADGQGDIAPARLAAAEAAAVAELRAYVAEMGAHPTLPDLAARVPQDALFVPQGATLRLLGIETAPAALAAAETALPARL